MLTQMPAKSDDLNGALLAAQQEAALMPGSVVHLNRVAEIALQLGDVMTAERAVSYTHLTLPTILRV